MSDRDRPRKSWREIDKARDGSSHRKDRPDASMLSRKGSGRSQQSYRAALDRLFDSGKIADLVDQKEPDEARPKKDNQGESRIKMLRKIRDAGDRDEVTKVADAYIKQFDLPDDIDVLPRLLEHRDPEVQRQTMERMDTLLDESQPKRTRAIVGQLKMIRDFADDQEMMELANKLIDRLD